jgi:hypothetical protein
MHYATVFKINHFESNRVFSDFFDLNFGRYSNDQLFNSDRRQQHESDWSSLLSGRRQTKKSEIRVSLRDSNIRSSLFDRSVFANFHRNWMRHFTGIWKSEIIRFIGNRILQRVVPTECRGPTGDHGRAGILSVEIGRDQSRMQFYLRWWRKLLLEVEE